MRLRTLSTVATTAALVIGGGGSAIALIGEDAPASPTAAEPTPCFDVSPGSILVNGEFVVDLGCAATTTTAGATTTSTTIAPSVPATSTTVAPTTTAPASTTTTQAPTTTARPTTTTAAPTTTVPPSSSTTSSTTTMTTAPPTNPTAGCTSFSPAQVLWKECFTAPSGMDNIIKEVHAGDPVNFVAQHFNGDHNQACAAPPTVRPIVENHQVANHFYYCQPNATNPESGHMMTSLNTQGYVIMSFAPRDPATGRARVFGADANQICWDQNLTDLGGRKWTQLMVLSEATYNANYVAGDHISYLNPGNNDNFSAVNPQHRPTGNDLTIKFLKNTVEAFRGQTKIYDNFFYPANGITDKATRYTTCVRDLGNGQLRFTQERPASMAGVGTTVLPSPTNRFETDGRMQFRLDFPGSFPSGNIVFIIGDDNYNVLKSYEEGATQYVTDPFTWHWDNLEIIS